MKKFICIFMTFAAFYCCSSSNAFGQISFVKYDSIVFNNYCNSVMVTIDDMDNDSTNEIISMYEPSTNPVTLMKITKMIQVGGFNYTSSNWSFPYQGVKNFITLDANNDSIEDIAIVHSDSVTLILRDSNGMFSNRISMYSGNTTDAIAKGDFNKDGRDDFVTSNWNDMILTVFIQSNTGFYASNLSAIQAGYNQIKVCDINQDGWEDIVFMAGQGLQAGIYVYLNNNGFISSTSTYFPVVGISGNTLTISSVSFGNFFGTGPGLLVNSSSYGPYYAPSRFIRYQNGNWISDSVDGLKSYFKSTVVADFDGDDDDESVYLYEGFEQLRIVDFNTPLSSTTLNIHTSYGNYQAQFDQMLAAGDIVGNDGKIDFVLISDDGQLNIFQNTSTITTNISNHKSESNIKIYPNPASDYIQVSLAKTGEYNLMVTDITGRIVLQKSHNGQNFKIDLDSIPAGIYFLKVIGKESFSKKFIVR